MSTRFIWRSHHIFYTQTHILHIRRELSHISPKALSSQKPDFEPYIYSISFESGDTVSATKLNARCLELYAYEEKKHITWICAIRWLYGTILYIYNLNRMFVYVSPLTMPWQEILYVLVCMYTTFSISFWWIWQAIVIEVPYYQ